MASRQTTYFLVPRWKNEDYTKDVLLGNVIASTDAPHKAIFEPSKAEPAPIELDGKPQDPQVATEVFREYGKEEKRKMGLFAKVLELLAVGLNISRTTAGTVTERYDVDELTLTTFRPTQAFVDKVAAPPEVHARLTSSSARRVFLITGVGVARGIRYAGSASGEREWDASMGIQASGAELGPSCNDSRKDTDAGGEKQAGPKLLAFRVSKIQLGGGGEPEASDYDGDFYGEDDEPPTEEEEDHVVFDVELDARDKAGKQVVEAALDIAGSADEADDECLLVYPKNWVQ